VGTPFSNQPQRSEKLLLPWTKNRNSTLITRKRFSGPQLVHKFRGTFHHCGFQSLASDTKEYTGKHSVCHDSIVSDFTTTNDRRPLPSQTEIKTLSLFGVLQARFARAHARRER